MNRGRWKAGAVGLVLGLTSGGCVPVAGVASLVWPEQRHLDVRDPSQLVASRVPALPPPETVTHRAPEVEPRQFSLDQTIRVALENSRVVRVLAGVTAVSSGQTVYDPAIANTAIDEQRAVFDPFLEIRNAFNRSEVPQAVFAPDDPLGARITGTRVDDYDLNARLSKRFVTGGTLDLNVANTHSRFTPGPAPLNPLDRSAVTLSFTQPLLQGAGVGPNVAPIVIARINTERSYFQLKDAMQELVRGTIEAYWAVVFARTDTWARRQQVEQGQAAVVLEEARLKVGFGNAAEVAQARVALANFRAALISAEANLLQREAALRNILGLPPTEPERFVPTTAATSDRVEPKWDEVLRLAADRRPDIVELKLILEADQQVLLQARNQAQPRVDATALYRWNGLEGETPTGANLSSGAGQFTDWTLGVNFSVPLGLRQGRAGLRRAELVLARDQANLEQGLHAMTHTLAASLRNLAQFYEQYRAFREARAAARINLERQLEAFRANRTIFLNVLQAITSWGDSVSAEAQALAQYNSELANLEAETGTILETHGVRFAEERYRSIGPLGRCAEPRCYPHALPAGPNEPRYPSSSEPAEKAFNLENPAKADPAPPRPESPPPPATLLKPRPVDR
jgi:outer membrane protein TolC